MAELVEAIQETEQTEVGWERDMLKVADWELVKMDAEADVDVNVDAMDMHAVDMIAADRDAVDMDAVGE